MIDDREALIATHRARVMETFVPPPTRHDDEVVQWHPLLLAEAAKAAFASRLLDAVAAAHAKRLLQLCVTVACPALADGMGDVVLAWRVCEALLRDVPLVDITLMVPDTEAATTAGSDLASVRVVAPATDFDARCDLLIVTPGISAARYASGDMHRWLDEAARRFPMLEISEYGSAAPASPDGAMLATGLGPLAEGMFIDPTLAADAAALRNASLAVRTQALRTWLAQALPDVAGDWQALHVIYVREPEALPSAVSRARLHIAADAAPQQCLILVLRHALTPQVVAAAAGAHVEVRGILPRAQFREALVHADFAAVTGDQSLAEAIAAQVRFVYEVRTHKQSLAHRLQEIASRTTPEVHAAMAPLSASPGCTVAARPAWEAMCRHICTAYDATPRLAGRALRTARGRAFHALETRVASACDPADSHNDVALMLHLQALQAAWNAMK